MLQSEVLLNAMLLTPIQGSAADIIKVAMVRIHKRLEQDNKKSKMIMQVHDELNFNVVPEELDYIRDGCRRDGELISHECSAKDRDWGRRKLARSTLMLENLAEYGYWGLLLASFLAATILPFSSEVVFSALIAAGLDMWTLIIYATIGMCRRFHMLLPWPFRKSGMA